MGKTRIHLRIRENLLGIVKVSWISLFLFVFFYMVRMVIRNYSWGWEYFSSPLTNLFNLSLTFFYITLFVILYHWGAGRYIFDRFRFIGKMTLTSYLTHSLVYLILFYDFNLGFYQEWPTVITPFIAVPLFWLQSEVSEFWLQRYGHGPVEKVWRFFTYFRLRDSRF